MKIIKLDAIFGEVRYDTNQPVMVDMEIFQIVESEIEFAPVGSFILDAQKQHTTVEKIIDYIYQLVSEGRSQDIREFTYEPEQVNRAECRATKFLKQLRREISLDVII